MKQKTNSAAKKRFNITASGKIKRRPVHQSHFNARDKGQEGRRKRKDHMVNISDIPRVKQLLPNK